MSYANFLLYGRMREQIAYFVRGMRSVFSEEFFSIFFPDEIDTLISGGASLELGRSPMLMSKACLATLSETPRRLPLSRMLLL